jgi:2-polyprenyl-3-methyl-5-hydroxy-6-metoxy-1,4-benzoquinol methylase
MRGEKFCRICESKNLDLVIDLGKIPLANNLPNSRETEVQNTQLKFSLCRNCGLGQIPDYVSSEKLFSDYRYLSSISQEWDTHVQKLYEYVIENFDLTQKKNYVLEIASNDGYLLNKFVKAGKEVLGVEPSQNISEISVGKKIPTINNFFSSKLAQYILAKHGYPKVIIALNVLAHVPDINDFVDGLSILSNNQTKIIIENPSILNILNKMQFDTIYQEHFSYLSGHALSHLAKKYNLVIEDISEQKSHGGSNRYILAKNMDFKSNINVESFIQMEVNNGLMDVEKWKQTGYFINNLKLEIQNWFKQKSNSLVIGFSAAAKTGTLLNYVGVTSTELHAIVDSSPEKVGRYLPNSMIPIVGIEFAKKLSPTDIIIFAWNIKNEIYSIIRKNFNKNVRVWQFIPEIREINE